MEELIGQSLDRYQLVSLLGEGGMGAVFKARDITLQRDVAIKIMHPQFARRPDFQERFLQEARTAARMSHPGIVQVHDFGQARSHLYIVMEFIPGDNLRQMLQDLRATNQWIVLPEAIQIVQQVSLALDYAHRQGVLHRDIKPDNVMLKAEPSEGLSYRPVITDLGLAKLAEGGLLTQEGMSMGTPAYMSPEQAMGQATDARSDVYSLGILLYELAVGRLPFRVKTITEAIRCHTKEPPPPPRSIRPDLPEPMERILLRALAKDPADRFPNAKALADALVDALPAASVATAPPTALAGAVSLMTQYQQSLVEARGSSILEEFPEPPADLSQDRVSILAQDHTIRSVSMKPGGLTIGRSADNDVALDDSKVSRHHARIEFDGTNYQVVDLNSTNGTYLANVKLLPGVAEVWTPDKALRIGDHWLRLEQARRPGGTAMFRSDGTMVAPSLIRSSAGPGRVGVFMERAQLSVEPGSSTTASVIVLNQGPVVDHFQTSVEGVPADWVPVIPPPVRLMPGAQQEVTLTIQPSRSPQSRAGRYPLAIRVASQDAPDQVAEVKGTLTVAAYSQFSSDLKLQRIRAGKPAQVTVQNQGNTRQTFTLAWQDRADELAFQPPQARLTVPEGQVAAAEFRAVPRQRRWIGGTKTYPFSAQVSSAEGETRTHNGEVLSSGLIPVWFPPFLFFICLLLAGAGALAYGWKSSQDAQATQTAIASQTFGAQTAEATLTLIALTDTDGDGLTDVEEGKLGTDATKADTDGDGLSDKEEVGGGTEPTNADTDGDGLSDGDEKSWGADPQVVDTDGDTLPDGKEVHGWEVNGQTFHTSPINSDTDGDTLPDNVDPDPGKLPTPTPPPTSTSTPTFTPIPTDTPTPTSTPPPTGTSTPTPSPTSTLSPTPTPTEEEEPASTVDATGLNPSSPAGLRFGQNVNIAFNYSTNEAGGVRIFARPFANGARASNYAASGSPIYPVGAGSGSGSFTIQSGQVTVDQIRFQMWNADQSTLLHESFVPVNYRFTDHAISAINLNPSSPAQLTFGQDVNITFHYSTNQAGGVRIFPRPFANGARAPNYAASGSPIYPVGEGNGSASFTISSGEVTVDQIRFQVWTADQNQLLDEWFITVNYRFTD